MAEQRANNMTIFLQNIQGINDYFTSLEVSDELINSRIIHKQYLAYYLYRIICKYYGIIKQMTNVALIREKIFNVLNIPPEFEGCYALAGKMIRDEDKLELLLKNMTNLLEAYNNKKTGLINENSKEYKDFEELLASKNTVEIINKDIVRLYNYLPSLSGSAIVPISQAYILPPSRKDKKNVKSTTNS